MQYQLDIIKANRVLAAANQIRTAQCLLIHLSWESEGQKRNHSGEVLLLKPLFSTNGPQSTLPIHLAYLLTFPSALKGY